MSLIDFCWRAISGLGIFWTGYRLGMWDVKRRIRLSPEMAALLRRPTVDGVARKILQKRGLCAYSDVMLQGETITLVCHDKALLHLASEAIGHFKPALQKRMASWREVNTKGFPEDEIAR